MPHGVACRERSLEILEPLLHVADDFHGVRARLLPDLQHDRRLAIQAGQRRRLRLAVLDAGDVVHANGMAGHITNDDLAELPRRFDPAARPHRDRLGSALDPAARDVRVLHLKGARDLVDRQILRAQTLARRARR